jgi:hypothetical protein
MMMFSDARDDRREDMTFVIPGLTRDPFQIVERDRGRSTLILIQLGSDAASAWIPAQGRDDEAERWEPLSEPAMHELRAAVVARRARIVTQ